MPDTTTPAASRLNAAPTPRESPRDVDRENSVLRELVTVYRHLSGLAMQDADLAGVVQLISERATGHRGGGQPADGRADRGLARAAAGEGGRAGPGARRPPAARAGAARLPALASGRCGCRTSAGCPAIIVAPILVGDEVPSYLITLDPAEESFGEDMSLLVTEHAATICGVILGRERVVAAAARRVRDDLVEGLLLGRGRDAADAARWAGAPRLRPDPGAQRGGDRLRAAAGAGRPTPSRCGSGSGSRSSTS